MNQSDLWAVDEAVSKRIAGVRTTINYLSFVLFLVCVFLSLSVGGLVNRIKALESDVAALKKETSK